MDAKAFWAGVDLFCKQAGFDSDDKQALAQLLAFKKYAEGDDLNTFRGFSSGSVARDLRPTGAPEIDLFQQLGEIGQLGGGGGRSINIPGVDGGEYVDAAPAAEAAAPATPAASGLAGAAKGALRVVAPRSAPLHWGSQSWAGRSSALREVAPQSAPARSGVSAGMRGGNADFSYYQPWQQHYESLKQRVAQGGREGVLAGRQMRQMEDRQHAMQGRLSSIQVDLLGMGNSDRAERLGTRMLGGSGRDSVQAAYMRHMARGGGAPNYSYPATPPPPQQEARRPIVPKKEDKTASVNFTRGAAACPVVKKAGEDTYGRWYSSISVAKDKPPNPFQPSNIGLKFLSNSKKKLTAVPTKPETKEQPKSEGSEYSVGDFQSVGQTVKPKVNAPLRSEDQFAQSTPPGAVKEQPVTPLNPKPQTQPKAIAQPVVAGERDIFGGSSINGDSSTQEQSGAQVMADPNWALKE